MQLRSDTIVALSTAPGRSAIAVVRLSGPEAHRLGQRISSRWPDQARVATYAELSDPLGGQPIDQALVTRFDAPRSYTGEPLVEFACHGGVSVVHDLVATLVHLGARPADPGEFTQRAVLNGKMDLLQAEAVGDLVDAKTAAHRQVALAQLHGSLSALVTELRDAIVQVEALLAYDVDFPEEDDGPVPRRRIADAARVVEARLAGLIATAPLGDVARDGALVVLAGVPNAGKSSLFNALLGEERAIVTEVAGTTRDAIEARVERRPWPLRLVDTAGLRPTTDRIERLGIEASERHIGAAHLVIVCGEGDDDLAAAYAHVRERTGSPVVRVQTKGDQTSIRAVGSDVKLSAMTREGLPDLLHLVDDELTRRLGAVPVDGAVITRARQRTALESAREELLAFIEVWELNHLPGAIAAIHVRSAAAALDELIGSVDVEDVLDRVFRTFCVGK